MSSALLSQDNTQFEARSGSPLEQLTEDRGTGKFSEDFDHSRPHSSVGSSRPQSRGQNNSAQSAGMDGEVGRSDSAASGSQTLLPSRGGTLKKKNSLKRGSSLRRSNSRKSLAAGSVKSLHLGDKEKYEGSDLYSAFFTPVPTKGNPTDILANRFQEWRRVLKDLISYYREVQKSHEARSKSLLSLANIGSNLTYPQGFLKEGGISEALVILTKHNKHALAEANKARNIEEDIIVQLTGLRNDLSQKIKEIKNLSGDFKNSVDKEAESTRKAVRNLQEALGLVDRDSSATSGKGDPYIVKLAVDRQIEKQIDEENYLHRAFLNLENSGRELESIVIGEIQKAHNAYAGILKREADEAYDTVEQLRAGPVAMPRDHEWDSFVMDNENFVDPRMPIRHSEQITYPGKDAPAAAEIRSGMLERKSKYLKSYTPGWYVLSPTHLHEFKSADRINLQAPVMSLYLHEQKLGSHSANDSSSHKFMLKGRQTGGMHRGHGWVFRAESRDTMLAWYNDIKCMTEKTGMERDAYVRKHARSISQGSTGARSGSSDGGLDEDEADQTPFSPVASQVDGPAIAQTPKRPQPGGRFPSDLNVQRGLLAPLSPSSGTSSDSHDAIAAAGALPGSGVPFGDSGHIVKAHEDEIHSSREHYNHQQDVQSFQPESANPEPILEQTYTSATRQDQPTTRQGEPTSSMEPQLNTLIDPPVIERLPSQSELPERHPEHVVDRTFTAVVDTTPLALATELSEATPVPLAEELGEATPIAEPSFSTLQPGFIRPNIERKPSDTETQASMMTTLTDSTTGVPFGGDKPPFVSQASVSTISDLHIPGEFPRNAR